MGVIVVLFVFAAIFWSAFEQAPTSLNLFARDFTDRAVGGFDDPRHLVPVGELGVHHPARAGLRGDLDGARAQAGVDLSSPAKFALGLLFAGVGFALMIVAANRVVASGGTLLVSPWWLVGSYFFQTIGELCLSPVGLSSMTKLSPRKYVGQMMGIWFLASAVGNLIGGLVGGNVDPEKLEQMPQAVHADHDVAARRHAHSRRADRARAPDDGGREVARRHSRTSHTCPAPPTRRSRPAEQAGGIARSRALRMSSGSRQNVRVRSALLMRISNRAFGSPPTGTPKSSRHKRRDRRGTAASTPTPTVPRTGDVVANGTSPAQIFPTSAKKASPRSPIVVRGVGSQRCSTRSTARWAPAHARVAVARSSRLRDRRR